jgi:photosystem II stability/assembly factor-like uncharacterized protein
MNYWKLACSALILVISCASPPFKSVRLDVPEASIRALAVAGTDTVLFAGSGGKWGYTSDAGVTWHVDTLLVEGKHPEVRSVAIVNGAALALSVGSPAFFMRSEDWQTWEVVYREEGEGVFWDAMAFWDDRDGIAFGDPCALDSTCASLALTHDGGRTWSRISCDDLPAALPGEAAFAASNTNVVALGNAAWCITGGSASRVLKTADRGVSWEVVETPILQGGAMTGMFSLTMWTEQEGLAIGGNWEQMSDNAANRIRTRNGGQSWSLDHPGSGPGYRSCIQAVPNTNGQELWAVGIPGVDRSFDGGATWTHQSDSTFLTVRFTQDGKTAWLAGRGAVESRATH